MKTTYTVLVGADQRIGVYDALKGVTINAAYEYFEENEKEPKFFKCTSPQ